MAKRKEISKRTRFEIFKRDSFTCQYCGRTPPTVMLNVDHIVAVATGGDNAQENLLTACEDCNSGKSDKPLGQVMPTLKSQMTEKRERSEQVAEFSAFLLEQRAATDEAIRTLGLHWHNQFAGEGRFVFGSARIPSIRTFLARMPAAQIMEAMDIALGRVAAYPGDDHRAFKYFCGVCWGMIREARGND